jgi:Xaa-Pro aminopeptidase
MSAISFKEQFLAGAFPEQELGFSFGEYRDRHRRLKEAMTAAGVDVVYLSSPESICWATGYQAEWYHGQSPTQWPAFSGVAVHVDHDDWLHFETEDELLLTRITSVSRNVRIGGDLDLLESIMDGLTAEHWLGDGVVVGLELSNYRPNRAQSEVFQQAIESTGASTVDVTTLLRAARRVKSPQEQAHVRTAQRIADIGMQAARDVLAPGITELDVYAEIVYAMARAGGENPGITMPVASGAKSASVHGLASRRKIMPGDIVNVDVSGVYFRYHANMARTFSVGEPHPEVAHYVERSLGALDVVREHLRPGVAAPELIARLREFYEEAGLWENRWWVGGYELGIAFPPDWVGEFVYDEDAGADKVFVAGEVLNYEANFYLPKHAGLTMGINTLIVDETGPEFLQRTPNEFFVVGA